jgi:hypothetical protein
LVFVLEHASRVGAPAAQEAVPRRVTGPTSHKVTTCGQLPLRHTVVWSAVEGCVRQFAPILTYACRREPHSTAAHSRVPRRRAVLHGAAVWPRLARAGFNPGRRDVGGTRVPGCGGA